MKWYSRSRSVPATPRGLPADAIAGNPGPGCMSMVHYLIFAPGAGCVGRPPSSASNDSAGAGAAVVSSSHKLSSPSPSPHEKGLEAPRNSLELDADQLRDIQIGVQVEPAFDALAVAGRRSTGSRATAPPSEAGTPRTPSLVARLMGIDGLPDDACSPSPGLKKSGGNPRASAAAVKEKKKRVIPESMNRQPLRSLSCNVGAGDARSLPDTPRASASSARTASAWDVVDRPRLSLQVLKENVLDRAAQYMSMPTSPTSAKKKKDRRDGDAVGHRRRDAKEHAREIVRQAKETVTNRKSGGKQKPTTARAGCNDKENAIPFAVEDKKMVVVQVPAPAASIVTPTAPPTPQAKAQADQQQQPHAPRLPPPPPPMRAKPTRPPPPPPPPDHPIPTTPARAAPLSPQAVQCKRPPDGCERFATRVKKPPAETTIEKAAPPSSPSAVAGATAPAASSHARVVDQHHRRRLLPPAVASTSSSSSSLEDDPEYGYLRTVLERGGFMRAVPPPHRPFKGHSMSSPVDPIVFHLLELDLPADDSDDHRKGPLRHRWNRKLLFHLTQEILTNLLHPDDNGPSSATRPHGPALLSKLWSTVKAFPAADCRVVGDIDALVALDLDSASVRGLARHPAVAEEAGDVAEDVAELVLDALLRESLPPSSWSRSPARAPR
ncbi:proteoglycan 4 [Triticum aestivum]|uniref:proteoglycan 4 n=1 Tax=Triticum aestivum TaxID=4565 RepID=UPI001D01E71B|nr:proteoglycan 4-like [Triticum aestivum]